MWSQGSYIDKQVVAMLKRDSQALVKSAAHSEWTNARKNLLNVMEFQMVKRYLLCIGLYAMHYYFISLSCQHAQLFLIV
jgi:hypothetical protein